MKERPILFSAPMVRALLAGTKTQTRRVLRDQDPIDLGAAMHGAHLSRRPVFDQETLIGHRLAPVVSPYGQPGDRLWVREAWRTLPGLYDDKAPRDLRPDLPLRFDADGVFSGCSFHPGKYRPPMFMPRWASRIDLEVTGVRVERLQDISALDALEEGLNHCTDLPYRWDHPVCMQTAQRLYSELWEQINGPGSWAANPWVWVAEFRRIRP